MAARRVYGCSDMAALLKKGETSSLALIASSSSSSNYTGFDGSISILNFERDCGNAMNQPCYGQVDAEENGDDDLDACLQQPEKKRRLAADKVQFLEKSFELENKLEPERKIQLAKDLGLQPRQVAIWFQNRRARWKTKQLEKDYEALKSGYNVLKIDCENLQKDNEKLKAEVSFLTDLEEKEKGMTKAAQLKMLENEVIGAKEPKKQVLEVKHEDLSSTNSAILNSADSNAFDHDHSDLSHVDEDEEEKGYHLFEDNPDSFTFPVQDQAFWFWP